MKFALLALTLAVTGGLLAQRPQFTDPANLRGERVKARDGRELPIDTGTLGLQQLLRKLNTRASILNIVAHPDDEDGGMLTLYARGLGARVADLSLTRGEGGQNAMTGDFEDALGLLRTQELLANDRYTGVDQMFGTEVDFGFSKTKQEAFAKWTHDRVLYDAVRAIRLYRPLVITATFIGGVTDGHGQHQVSGQIAQEAFLAAGDPTVFPDQIAEGILPWQPLRVYARVPTQSITPQGLYDYATNQYVPVEFANYVTGETTTTPPSADIIVHEGTPDPLLTICAANPSDLPTTLRSANTLPSSSAISSSSKNTLPFPTQKIAGPSFLLSSFRNAGGSASRASSDCKPLSYVQFARIGLGLQRSQIGPGVRTAPTGTFDVAYHLYGSCLPDSPTLNLCHLEANHPGLTTAASPSSATNPSASGAPFTSVGRSPTKSPNKNHKGPEVRPIDASTDPNFFTGIDTSIEGIATLAPDAAASFRASLNAIVKLLATAEKNFKPNDLQATASVLADAAKKLNAQIADVDLPSRAAKPWNFTEKQLTWFKVPHAQLDAILHELKIKQVQLNEALALSLDLQIDATLPAISNGFSQSPEEGDIVDSGYVGVATHTTRSNSVSFEGGQEWLESGKYPTDNGQPPPYDQSEITPAAVDQVLIHNHIDNFFTLSRPYFHRDTISQPVYDLKDSSLRNAPTSPPSLTAWETVTYEDVHIVIGRIVHDGPQPIRFILPVSALFQSPAQIIVQDAETFPLRISEHTHSGNWKYACYGLKTPQGMSPTRNDVETGEEVFTVKIDSSYRPEKSFEISATAMAHGGGSNRLDSNLEGYRSIGYGDLPRTNYYTPATTRIVPVDLQLPTHHNIAYLPGTGDAVPEALASINLTPTILTVADLTPTNLAHYDTVILGVRTYAAHPNLHGTPTAALLDYARNGGNVVVQYQTPEFTAADAPYPLSLGSNEKVVDETAPVQLLDPHNTLLTTPNLITPVDFNNWIEERGHGFLATWDGHYTALTETHDSGAPDEHVAPQLPQRGGLITTPLGSDSKHQGRWTYVAFALYRQLPEAVPGAYRLFLNLLNP